MKYKDYYRTLGVSRDADRDEIRRAYRRLARKYHPDVSVEPDAEERFKSVHEAYDVLKDAKKRAAYDQLGSGWRAGQDFTPPPGWERAFGFGGARGRSERRGGFDFGDLFEGLFGDGPDGFRGASPFTASAGSADRRVRVEVSLEEAYRGAAKVVELPDSGFRGAPRRLNVKIPAGVSGGQQIRLAAQAGAGAHGVRGDLYIEIEIAPHRSYRVDGHDVHLDLPVTPWEAALGATIKVPTLGGAVDLKIPAGSQSGRKLRLRGRGLGARSKGDQYLTVQIVTPKADTAAARELYERMAEQMPLNPRAHLGV